MGIEGEGFKSGTVSPEEVMASDPTKARAHLEAEITRLEAESEAVLGGADTQDAPIDGNRFQDISAKLRDLRIQLAQLNPVPLDDEPEE